jgi:protein arginine kinase activator
MGNYTAKLIKSSSEPMLYRILWDTREECPAGSQVGPEVRALYLIECNVSGYGAVRVNNKDFKVGPRCCYILRPGDEVTLYAAEKDPKISLWCIFGGARVSEKKLCPLCGSTKSDLARTGRAGCAECYNVFSEELSKIIYGIHGNTTHLGTAPGKHVEELNKRDEIEALKKEQEEAVLSENYEKAAEIRDKIKALESEEEK